jgi:hypothetical protein
MFSLFGRPAHVAGSPAPAVGAAYQMLPIGQMLLIGKMLPIGQMLLIGRMLLILPAPAVGAAHMTLSEAESFLEQYAKRSPANQALIGAAGNLVQTENLLAIPDSERDEEGDLQSERVTARSVLPQHQLMWFPKQRALLCSFQVK